jgi:uncharacterized phiE125 gp8 family phage protein
MYLSYKDTSSPIVEPVTLALAKQQCIVDAGMTDDDDLITGLIVAARTYVEGIMQRAIYNRTMTLNMDFFPFPTYGGTVNANDAHVLYGKYWHQLAIMLPRPSAVSVQSITYVDLSGVTQTLDSSLYYLDVSSEPARIVPNPGLYWPYTQSYLPGSVCVSYTAGTYGDGVTANTCPQTIVQACLLLISYWYNNRDAAAQSSPKSIEMGVESLLATHNFESFV